MTTTNNRTKIVQAASINGVDAGGLMSAEFRSGFDNIIRSGIDGIGGPSLQDKVTQFVRGSIASQDWIHLVDLLTGTLGTYTCYERKSGVPEATGYIKHTITNPVIHRASLSMSQNGYMSVASDFECKAADETKGFSDMWTQEDSQAKPAYVPAARGGYRVKSVVYDPDTGDDINIYHTTAFSFLIQLVLDTACNDLDIGYTCVDVEADGGTYNGSISFEDSKIESSLATAQRILAAGRGSLVITVTMSASATDKVITIAGVDPESITRNSGTKFTGHTLNYTIANNPDTPLTLSGANKIITIADAA